MTDNKVRTVAEVRHALSKHGGNMGTEGSVAFQFKHCGQLIFAPGASEDKIMEVALESGADIRTALVTFGVDASHGYERIHESALKDLSRLLVAYVESDVEIKRDARPISGVKGFTHQPMGDPRD
jgi:transcriptional/translational regulatory protein YebC/TACO1